MMPPKINLEEARLFVDTLAPDGKLTFQVFPERADVKGMVKAQVLQGDLDSSADTLVGCNLNGCGIFLMVNEGDGLGRKAKNVVKVRSYFADLDGAPVDPLLEAELPPHILVESSPARWHGYWLAAGCPLDQFKMRQQSLAARFGGDPSVCDLPRVMRVPGFLHQKGDPFRTRLVWPVPPKMEACDHE